jgi:hypothetical protein
MTILQKIRYNFLLQMLTCLHAVIINGRKSDNPASVKFTLTMHMPTKVALWDKFNSTHYSTNETISLLTRYGFMSFLCSLNSETPWKVQDMMMCKQLDKL